MSKKGPVLAGHMKKAIERLESLSGVVNLVAEVLDARAPLATHVDTASTVLRGLPRVLVMTKADLADDSVTKRWRDYYDNAGTPAVVFPFGAQKRKNSFISDLKKAAGMSPTEEEPIKIVVVGLPNVGKSTVLNFMTGKKSAKTGAMPGITRGVQIIKVSDDFLVLDTPGIVSSAAGNRDNAHLLALTGCLQESFFDAEQVSFSLAEIMSLRYPEKLAAFYDIKDSFNTAGEFFERLCARRGFLRKGGVPDIEKGYSALLRDFSSGRITGVTLELPEDANNDE